MTKKQKIVATVLAVVAVGIGIIGFLLMNTGQITTPGQRPAETGQSDALASVINAADRHSGIEGATFPWQFSHAKGNATNFGIMRCDDEVRCEGVVTREVAVWMPTDGPATDMAEIDTQTHHVASFHRSVPDFAREGALPEAEIESKVRAFLAEAYPEFASIESTLTLDLGMKGARLNTGNYFYRWNDERYAVPESLSMDVPPFLQVGITASGFIFSYANTIPLYREPMWHDLKTLCAYVEMPFSDDSSFNPERSVVTVWFMDERGNNRYLLLPYEPRTDFAGCSPSAKEKLERVRGIDDRNRANGFYD